MTITNEDIDTAVLKIRSGKPMRASVCVATALGALRKERLQAALNKADADTIYRWKDAKLASLEPVAYVIYRAGIAVIFARSGPNVGRVWAGDETSLFTADGLDSAVRAINAFAHQPARKRLKKKEAPRFTLTEYRADTKRVMAAANEVGVAIVMDDSGKPILTLSALIEDLPALEDSYDLEEP